MTCGAHLTQDQLIEHLYCVTDEATAHLNRCVECRDRFLAIEQARIGIPAWLPSNDYFHRQRRTIAERMDRPPSLAWGSIWVPAALSLILVLGLLIGRAYAPTPAQPAMEETAEALEILEPGWFNETYAVMQVAEPRAATPIVHLFSPPVME